MHKSIRQCLVALCSAFILLGAILPQAALAGDTTRSEGGPISPVADLLVMRPIGFMATIAGAAIFTASAPLFLMFRPTEMDVPFQALVAAPARYTWVDPLGQH